MVLTAYGALSLVTGLSCHHPRAMRSIVASWHQRRGVRTTRFRRPLPHAFVWRMTSVHRIPHPTFRTTAKRTSLSRRDGATQCLWFARRGKGNFSRGRAGQAKQITWSLAVG